MIDTNRLGWFRHKLRDWSEGRNVYVDLVADLVCHINSGPWLT